MNLDEICSCIKTMMDDYEHYIVNDFSPSCKAQDMETIEKVKKALKVLKEMGE